MKALGPILQIKKIKRSVRYAFNSRRGRRFSEFKTRLVFRERFRTVRARNPVSKDPLKNQFSLSLSRYKKLGINTQINQIISKTS